MFEAPITKFSPIGRKFQTTGQRRGRKSALGRSTLRPYVGPEADAARREARATSGGDYIAHNNGYS